MADSVKFPTSVKDFSVTLKIKMKAKHLLVDTLMNKILTKINIGVCMHVCVWVCMYVSTYICCQDKDGLGDLLQVAPKVRAAALLHRS